MYPCQDVLTDKKPSHTGHEPVPAMVTCGGLSRLLGAVINVPGFWKHCTCFREPQSDAVVAPFTPCSS